MRPDGSDGRVVVITGASGGIGAGLARRLGPAGNRLVLAAFGRIDVWVNNAGRGITRPALELTDDDVDDMIATNVKSALYGVQAVAPHFIERNAGHIVNVSSFLGVHVSLVMPGLVATDFAHNAGSGGRTPPPTVTRPAGVSLAPQTVDEVVDMLVRLLQHPVPEVYTNPAQPGVVERYLSDVATFEARLERGA